ncbi:hypothetical protein KLF50_14940 (plasmid) [Clostridium perfringens]|uniref:hypothetical protein n=1 Tax=Clostridium perfringens TaxID=1502 RepID=UPI001CCFC936|nr:hypothetical protein [Clostridium perfringens]UBK83460.1 hypothetical protein KLF50_14940 [Clostridium perfringens]
MAFSWKEQFTEELEGKKINLLKVEECKGFQLTVYIAKEMLEFFDLPYVTIDVVDMVDQTFTIKEDKGKINNKWWFDARWIKGLAD